MSEVKNPVLVYADSYRDAANRGQKLADIWSVITDLERNIAPMWDAQRLRADTAEAERDAVKQALDATRDALEAAQYANAELTSKLSKRDQLFHALTHSPHAVAVPLELWKQIKVFAATLNPNPEAESHE